MRAHARAAAFVGLLSALRLAPLASAGPWMLAPKEYFSEIRGTAFETDSRFTDETNREPLPAGARYAERSLSLYSELGWHKNCNLIVSLPYKNAHFRQEVSGIDESQTGFQDLDLGLKFGLARGRLPAAVQVEWRTPLGYNNHLTPALGEGLQGLSGQLLVGASLPALGGFVQARGGYRYLARVPNETRERVYRLSTDVSSRVKETVEITGAETFFTADAGFWITRQLLLAGNVNGLWHSDEVSVKDEISLHTTAGDTSFTVSDDLGKLETFELLLGPTLIYRIDDTLDLVVGSSHTMAGRTTPRDIPSRLDRSALHTDRFFVGLAFKGTQLSRFQGFMGTAAER